MSSVSQANYLMKNTETCSISSHIWYSGLTWQHDSQQYTKLMRWIELAGSISPWKQVDVSVSSTEAETQGTADLFFRPSPFLVKTKPSCFLPANQSTRSRVRPDSVQDQHGGRRYCGTGNPLANNFLLRRKCRRLFGIQRKIMRFGVTDIFLKRENQGVFFNLVKELRLSDREYYSRWKYDHLDRLYTLSFFASPFRVFS